MYCVSQIFEHCCISMSDVVTEKHDVMQSLVLYKAWFNLKHGSADTLSAVFMCLTLLYSANLSELYFTERQDRYVVINRCPALADFFEEVVTAVSSLSFQLQPDDKIILSPDLQCHPFLG